MSYTITAASELTHQSLCLPVLVCSLSRSWFDCVSLTSLAVTLPAHKEMNESGWPLTLSVFLSPPLVQSLLSSSIYCTDKFDHKPLSSTVFSLAEGDTKFWPFFNS